MKELNALLDAIVYLFLPALFVFFIYQAHESPCYVNSSHPQDCNTGDHPELAKEIRK